MITFWPFWVPPGIWIIWLLWFWLACWMCTWSRMWWWRSGLYEQLIKSPAEVVPGSQLGQVGRSGFDRQLFGLFGAESGQWSLAEIEQNWVLIPSWVKSHLLLKYNMLPCLTPHTAEHLGKEQVMRRSKRVDSHRCLTKRDFSISKSNIQDMPRQGLNIFI